MHSHAASSGNEKRQSISPVARLSKLNKRRRFPKEGGIDEEQQVQRRKSLSSAATSAASKRSHFLHNEGIAFREGEAFAGDGACKENLLNGRHAFYARKPNNAAGGNRLDNNYLAAANCQAGDKKKMTAMHNQSIIYDEEKKTPSLSTSSALGFLDHMDKSTLLPAIISELGIHRSIMYKSPTPILFKRSLERSFECKAKNVDASVLPTNSKPDHYNAVYHDILGRIYPPSIIASSADTSTTRLRCEDVTDEPPSFAFPPCKSTRKSIVQNNYDSEFTLSQPWIHQRKTGQGLCIPPSWYCFPTCSKKQDAPSFEKVSVNQSTDDVNCSGKMKVDQESQSRALLFSSTRGIAAKSSHERHHIEMNEKQPPTLPTGTPRKCQGKIRIASDRGATIREVFDIEKSNFIIGKLNLGDERYYLEKKILPPPPISLLDDSDHENEGDYDDEDDDEECVAVVRYKIYLNRVDVAESNYGGDNPLVGWISDRGRLANDPYLILREI